MRIYVSAFDDGHFNLGAVGNTPNTFRWPGFLTDYDNAGDIRVTRVSDDVAMPIGAQLESCDGLSATAYAEATLGTIDRKSTRLNSIPNAHLVCRLMLEKKHKTLRHAA